MQMHNITRHWYLVPVLSILYRLTITVSRSYW